MKKYLLVIATLSIVPSVAFASWWNPLTWNIFSSHQPNSSIQIISTTTLPDQTLTDNSTTTAVTIPAATTTEVIVATTSTTRINILTKKVTTSVANLPAGMILNQTLTTSPVPIISSFTNGIITGQHFTGVTEVYVYSVPESGVTRQKADLQFEPQSDTEIDIHGSFNIDQPSSYYKLYVANVAGVSTPVNVTFTSSTDSSQTALSTQQGCFTRGFNEGLQIANNALTTIGSTLAIGEEQAQASARNSAYLNNYTKALTNICGMSLSTDQINSQLSQLESQLQQAVSASIQQQEQIQGLQQQQAALATPGSNNPLNFLYQGAGYNAPAIENTISHIYQPAISAIQSQQQPITVQSKTDVYGAVFAALDGTTVYVNNGGAYTRSGNNIYGPNGASYVISGSTIYGPNGTSYILDAGKLYGPNGATYTQSGNTISGSDGSSATAVGDTIYVQSGN